MPKLLSARALQNYIEERQIRRLAHSRHAPADRIFRARIIVRSCGGLRTKAIVSELGCHPQTVRERIARFSARGDRRVGRPNRSRTQAPHHGI